MNADAVKNITKFSFVALLVTGGVIAAAVIGINELKSDNLPETTPPAQTLATDSNGNSVYVDDGNEYTIIEENSPADTENPSAETTAAQTSAGAAHIGDAVHFGGLEPGMAHAQAGPFFGSFVHT